MVVSFLPIKYEDKKKYITTIDPIERAKYLIKDIQPTHLYILKLVSLIVLFLGCISSSTFLWSLVDIMMALLAIINIYALIKLKSDVKQEYEYYNRKKCDKIDKR